MIDHQACQELGAQGGQISPTSPTSGMSALPESPSKKRESYAVIDFVSMAALSNAKRQLPEEEGGVKTRHNSTLSEMQ